MDSESSDLPEISNSVEDDQIMTDREIENTKDANTEPLEDFTTANMEEGEINEEGEANYLENYIEEGDGGKIFHPGEDTLLQQLLTSAGDGTSLFTSWEPGRQGQFYFLTTKSGWR